MESKHPNWGLAGDRALALAVIYQAVQEMRDIESQSKTQIRQQRKIGSGGKGHFRVNATVWLASAQAAVWFERCDLDQAYALGKMDWAEHARELLDDEGVLLDRNKTRVLKIGLDVVEFTN
jgi:hypothetical protein|tara:strand:+ start:1328 stop:1690 length:363 start_codon:yes stop_codon:yes gene_type:complete